MSGAIEASVASEDLLDALQQGINELPDKLNQAGGQIAFIKHGYAVDEAPFITHNLQGSLTWESNGLLSWIIFPDEGIAPYALYVILGHMTRPKTIDTGDYGGKMSYGGDQRMVPGNPFLDRADAASEADTQAEIDNLEQWILDLLS